MRLIHHAFLAAFAYSRARLFAFLRTTSSLTRLAVVVADDEIISAGAAEGSDRVTVHCTTASEDAGHPVLVHRPQRFLVRL